MGIDMKGLKKDQYRVGIDVQQTVFRRRSHQEPQEVAREQGEVQKAQNEVKYIRCRKRVNEMYFGLLLLDEQMRLNSDLQEFLSGNEKKLAAMLKGGTASESDYLNVKAERLNAAQQLTSLEAQRQTLARMLSFLRNGGDPVPEAPCGPTAHVPEDRSSARAEAVDAQLRLADAQEKALNAALMPKWACLPKVSTAIRATICLRT